MKDVSAQLAAHLVGPVTTLATCWSILRRDGVAFLFTDHDKDIAFDGKTYVARFGYTRTAVSSDSELSVDNLDVDGVFDDAAITEEDMRAGLFDYAEVRIFLVNWADPGMGALKLRRGWFGEVMLTENGMFRSELRGLTQALQQDVGELYSAECRADLGDQRCRMPIMPDVVARATAYAEGDHVRVQTGGSPPLPLPIENGSFEEDGTGDGSGFTPTGWTLVSGDWDVHDAANGGLPADDGLHYLEGGSSSGELTQSIDLLAAGLDAAKIDAGDYRLEASISRANSFPDDLGRGVIEALDGASTLISVLYDTGLEEITPEDAWVVRAVSGAQVPPGARFVRFRLLHQLVAGFQGNAAFDTITGTISDATATPSFADFEDTIYRCVTAGTTDDVQPIYDTSVGAQTTDGTAVFEAEAAWTRAGVVASVTDRARFGATIAEPRAVDGWFNGGVLTWETGRNAGRSIEVRTWTDAGQVLELFLPMGYAIEVGDAFRIYPGCDKRFETCKARFANVLNFRGEPYVPGTDEVLGYPDAG